MILVSRIKTKGWQQSDILERNRVMKQGKHIEKEHHKIMEGPNAKRRT